MVGEKKTTERKYHGMTLEDIKAKYWIELNGNEPKDMLNWINGKISKIYQEVSFYATDTETELTTYTEALARMDEEFELAEQKTKLRLITENKVLSKADRWSDDARETMAFVESRSDEMRKRIADIKNEIAALRRELAVWTAVKKNLHFVSERINNISMNNAVENKYLSKEPTNIPHLQEPSDVSPQPSKVEQPTSSIREDLF